MTIKPPPPGACLPRVQVTRVINGRAITTSSIAPAHLTPQASRYAQQKLDPLPQSKPERFTKEADAIVAWLRAEKHVLSEKRSRLKRRGQSCETSNIEFAGINKLIERREAELRKEADEIH